MDTSREEQIIKSYFQKEITSQNVKPLLHVLEVFGRKQSIEWSRHRTKPQLTDETWSFVKRCNDDVLGRIEKVLRSEAQKSGGEVMEWEQFGTVRDQLIKIFKSGLPNIAFIQTYFARDSNATLPMSDTAKELIQELRKYVRDRRNQPLPLHEQECAWIQECLDTAVPTMKTVLLTEPAALKEAQEVEKALRALLPQPTA